jgi:UDP-glucuronate 4-epimerase
MDSFTPYYDTRIKERRNDILSKHPSFTLIRESISDYEKTLAAIAGSKPELVIHLAAQAGVRYSLKNPWAYADANYLGTLNVFEAARQSGVRKVLYASSSSVYGANAKTPFSETDRTDEPLSLYAASKKANEVLAYSYHHLYGMSTIGFRFFTVYGEFGRPDLALFKFVRNMLAGKEIALYNNGEMTRNFSYVGDIIDGIISAIRKNISGYEIYNLGGQEATPLKRFVELIEDSLKIKARIKLLPLQAGDVPATVADISKARHDLQFDPKTPIDKGIGIFSKWFLANKDWLLELADAEQ